VYQLVEQHNLYATTRKSVGATPHPDKSFDTVLLTLAPDLTVTNFLK
jgi:hypothetical protein